MDKSALLSLPYIMPSQAQKHVTHNEAIRKLDILIHLAVQSRTQNAPNDNEAEGTRFLVPQDAEGLWQGETHKLAAFVDGAWYFFEPQEGWRCYIIDEAKSVIFIDGEWQGESANADLNPVDMVGINTSADSYNRLSVAAASVLLTHEGDSHQLKINKHSSTDTASLLFQTNWSGHAEMGLNGSNDFSIKASADGASWAEYMLIHSSSKVIYLGDQVSRSKAQFAGPCGFAVYNKADIPLPEEAGEGAVIYIRELSGQGPYVYSDGVSWRLLKNDNLLT